MRKFIVTMAATTALVACGTIGCAEAAQPGASAIRSTADALRLTNTVQFLWEGYNYCWYDDGWNGAGWYRCDVDVWVEGQYWGGDYGWGVGHGWHGGHNWHGHGHDHGHNVHDHDHNVSGATTRAVTHGTTTRAVTRGATTRAVTRGSSGSGGRGGGGSGGRGGGSGGHGHH